MRESLVRVNHDRRKQASLAATRAPVETKSYIEPCMNKSGKITNGKTGKTFPIEVGSANDSGVIYGAKCRKHDMLCFGYTTNSLNERFNVHRSDIACKPNSCELVKPFSTNDCNFTSDLEISVLAYCNGSTEHMQLEEDKWITRLNSLQPNGLNEKLSPYGKLFYKLFGSN